MSVSREMTREECVEQLVRRAQTIAEQGKRIVELEAELRFAQDTTLWKDEFRLVRLRAETAEEERDKLHGRIHRMILQLQAALGEGGGG